MMAKRKTLALYLLVATAKAWELPAFLSDSLPTFETTTSIAAAPEESLIAGRDVQEVSTPGNVTVTDSPTESPAPSPSPSEEPTIAPTITNKPTEKPTESPTESPAPSPSPSEEPTLQPSDKPSFSPSHAPTFSSVPTAFPSEPPSDVPSESPSSSPSQGPSLSMAPSTEPSSVPSNAPSLTPSVMPSSSPTHMTLVAANFLDLMLPLAIPKLNNTQVASLEAATTFFAGASTLIESGKLDDVIVTVTGQKVVEVGYDRRRRELGPLGAFDVEQALAVNISMVALYIGSEIDFDLYETMVAEFEEQQDSWFQQLAVTDKVFQVLMPKDAVNTDQSGNEIFSSVVEPSDSNGGRVDRSETVLWISLLAVAAIGLGMAASMFAVRQHKKIVYGQALGSPRLSVESSNEGSRIARENEAYHQRSMIEEPNSPWFNHKQAPPSPNSMEKGNNSTTPVDHQVVQTRATARHQEAEQALENNGWGHIQKSYSNKSGNSRSSRNSRNSRNSRSSRNSRNSRAKDPPTAASEANFAYNQNQQENMRNTVSLFDNNTEMSDMTKSRISNGLPPAESNMEIQLTTQPSAQLIHPPGTLGAVEVPASNAGSGFSAPSDFSSHALSFFAGLVGRQENTTIQPSARPERLVDERGVLGAHAPPEMPTDDLSYDAMSRRAGLYDVFAPAGPIGIVVDTTKHGPAVHSLKRTSPMLGLINPGDLIVGLDDKDTRGMTAATLTRLMARKSNQKERKITLLTGENY